MSGIVSSPLRIFNGDTAIGSFRQAFGREASTDVLVCRDVLICGPLTEFSNLKEWRAGREEFWRAVLDGVDDSPILAGEAAQDVSFATKWRDLYADMDDLESADEIEVWIGCALSDQVLLAFVAFLIDRFEIDRDKLSVVQMEQSGDRVILGIGQLNSDALEKRPDPVRLGEDQFSYCLDVWRAVTADSPERLMTLMRADEAPLPIMHRALEALYYRYPDTLRGLSLWDQTTLELVTDRGRKAARIIGGTMSVAWESGHRLTFDSVGDLYLYYRLRNLARPTLAEPLAEASSLNAPMGFVEYKLTGAGRAVQAGERNAIDVNAIDDWVCGVHLSSEAGNVWVRKDGEILRQSE